MKTDERDLIFCGDGDQIVAEAMTAGYAIVEAPIDSAHAIDRLYQEMAVFFRTPAENKNLHACPNFRFGFREFGRQYSGDKDQLDLNESFTYWSDDQTTVPNYALVVDFIAALHSYWRIVAGIADAIFEGFARKFNYPYQINYKKDSYLETNWYRENETRELLQNRHEDGHLFTFVTADAAGLEIEVKGKMQPVNFSSREILIMPGSLATVMTGGLVQPLYHQVRNHRLAQRSSILFLINPPLADSIPPYVVNDYNLGVDVSELCRRNGQMFGLPPLPID